MDSGHLLHVVHPVFFVAFVVVSAMATRGAVIMVVDVMGVGGCGCGRGRERHVRADRWLVRG
jgi:hypothetical protein